MHTHSEISILLSLNHKYKRAKALQNKYWSLAERWNLSKGPDKVIIIGKGDNPGTVGCFVEHIQRRPNEYNYLRVLTLFLVTDYICCKLEELKQALSRSTYTGR